MSLEVPNKLQIRFWRIPLLILFAGAVLTLSTVYFIQSRNDFEAEARFDRISNNFLNAVKSRLHIYVGALSYTRNLFEVQPKLSREEFSNFIRKMEFSRDLPGIYNIGYVKTLPRKEGLRTIREFGLTPEKAGISSHEKTLSIITYVQPIALPSQGSPLGMNLSSSYIRKSAMDKAVQLGEPVATDRSLPISSSSTQDEYVFLIFVPQFKKNAQVETEDQRRKALVGFVYGGFRFANLFSQITNDMRMQRSGIRVEVFDGDNTKNENRVFAFGDNEKRSGSIKNLKLTQFNHTWTIRLIAPRNFTPSVAAWLPGVVGLLGFFITGVAVILTYRSQRLAYDLENDNRRHRKTEDQLRTKNELVDFTSQVGLSLMAEKDLSSIVQMVTDGGTSLVGAKFGAFFYNTVNESGEALMLYTLSGASPEIFKKLGMPRKTQVFQPSFDGEGIVRSDDITEDPRYGKNSPYHGMPKGHLPVKSYLSAPVISKSGKVLGVLLFGHPEPKVFTDRSEKIIRSIAIQAAVAMENAALYRELSAARQEADAANHAKTMFLANISHEMRTPLGIMIGHAELGSESDDIKRMKEAFDIIIRNGKDLTQIIGDVLDLSKIEANALHIDEIAICTRTLIEDLQAGWSQKVEAKGLRLDIYIEENVPDFFKTDRTRIKQILVNLLSNAVKFTESGFVKLNVSFKSDHDQSNLEFSVEDSGLGISEENKAKLFKIFSQVDSSITRKFGGNGLGLALSRQLARALRGDLFLQRSVEGEGSLFILRIPYEPAIEKSEQISHLPKEKARSLDGRRVLIVDDSPDNQMLVQMMLMKIGIKSDLASNGAEGVDLALSSDYDFILMDLQMPILDGYGALEKLRANGLKKPIVAISAHALKEEKKKALAKGFDAYLTKPIDQQVFFETLFELQDN